MYKLSCFSFTLVRGYCFVSFVIKKYISRLIKFTCISDGKVADKSPKGCRGVGQY